MGEIFQSWGIVRKGRVVAQVDDVTGLDLEIERNSRIGRGLYAGEPEHKCGRSIADKFGWAVEQFDLGGAGAGGRDGEVAQDLLAQVLGDVGSAQGAGQAFAGEPNLLRGFLDLTRRTP